MGDLAGLVLRGALELTWRAPPECPDAGELAARIDARTGAGVHAAARADARIEPSSAGYALTLDVTVIDAALIHRELTAPGCEELADAAALIIAVAVDPMDVASQPAIAQLVYEIGAAAPIEPRPRARVDAREPPSTPPRPRIPFAVALRPSVGAWIGALPRAATAIGFDVVLPARRSLRAELGIVAIPRQRIDVQPGAGAQLWLATAVLRGCFAPAVGRVRPMGCAGLAAGAIGGRGRGSAVQGNPAVTAWVSLTAAAGLTVMIIRRLELFARAEGHVHLRRPGFHLDAVGSVHRVGASSVTALGGLQLVLP
jgi:hypothetical protein